MDLTDTALWFRPEWPQWLCPETGEGHVWDFWEAPVPLTWCQLCMGYYRAEDAELAKRAAMYYYGLAEFKGGVDN